MAGKKKVKSGRLTVVNADCAGVDVGKSHHYVAVDPERFENPVRKFGSFTSDLGAFRCASSVRSPAIWVPWLSGSRHAG